MQQLLESHYQRYRHRLGQAFLACPSVDDRDSRTAVINELPSDIRRNRNENLSTVKGIVDGLIQTAVNYDNGLNDLVEAVAHIEGETLSMQALRDEWQTIQEEITEQETLIAQLQASQLTFSDLRRLYDEVKPDNYHAPHISSIEWLVAALWEVPEGHVPLHTFMQRATGQPVERPDKPPQAEATQLIVMIEPGKQAEDSMLLSLWVNHNDRQDNLLPGVEIKLSQLDAEIGGELELWTAAFPDTQAIEFYLPKALLKLPVDDWEVGSGLEKQRLVKQYHISRGTLERHRARAILKQLRQLSHPEQRNVMLALRQKPLMLALMRHSGHWETRWQQLQRHERCHLQLLACPIDRQAIRTMDVLQTNVPASTCFALLTFTPGDLASEQLDDPLGLLLTTGLPLIAWARAGDGTTAFSQHLQAKVLDDHCNHIIRDGAADIVALIHQIQRQPLDEDTDPHHIGRQLSLVLDNPERDLPLELERIRM